MSSPMAGLLCTLIWATAAHNSSVRSDEGLTLEASAFQVFRCGDSAFVGSFDKAEFLDYYTNRILLIIISHGFVGELQGWRWIAL